MTANYSNIRFCCNFYHSDPTLNPLLLPGDDNSSGHGPSGAKDGTRISHNRMSPPPSYDEVVFNVDYAEEKKMGRSVLDAGNIIQIRFIW